MLVRRLWLFVFLALLSFAGGGCSADTGEVADEAAAVEEAPAEATGEDGVTYPSESLAPEEAPAEPGSLEARLRDASLATQVKMQLVQETALRPYTFEVAANGGRVTIAGRVASADMRAQAEQVAGRVSGVREVHNRIEAPGAPPPSEENLADVEAPPPPTEEGAAVEEPATSAPATPSTPEPTPPSEPSYHTVQSGESLWVIARRYDLSVNQLKQLNNLGANNNLRPGQRLRVE